jgi:hypothetical protein
MVVSIRRALGVAVVAATAGSVSVAAQAPSPPQISVGVLSYAQYVYQLKDTINHFNNFDIKRAYVNVIGRFAGGVYARITADIYVPTTADSGSRSYRIKYAYVQYTPTGSPLAFKIGEIHTAWLDWEEAMWDYRMQGTMALERNGYASSAGFGVGVDGKWGPDKVNMQVVLTNDRTYSQGTGDQRKWAQARVSVRALDTDDSSRVGGLRVTGFAEYGNAVGGAQRQRWLGMVSYKTKQLTLAGEAAITRDPGAGGIRVNGHVFSGFGVYKIPQSKAALIGRVDIFHPQAGNTTDKQTRFIGGASYQISPNLRVLGDWDFVSYQGTPTAGQEATRSQALFQTQFNF